LISPDPKEIVEQNSKAFEQQLISTVPSAEAYMTQFIAKIDQLRSILEQQYDITLYMMELCRVDFDVLICGWCLF